MPRAAKMTDVTVVGAGPAGAMTAFYLAVLGLQVQIIEKRKFPRHKLCGGGLTRRALQAIPFDLSEVIEDVGHTIQLSIGERLLMKRRFSPPPVVLVRRERFDAFLLEKALGAGARFQDNTVFRGLTGSFGNLVIQTSQGIFRSRVIVGADGTQSRVRKALGCRGPQAAMVALAATVRPSGAGAMTAFRSRIDFDFQRKWMGYGWVFPKNSELSVGIMSHGSRPGSMKSRFYEYLHRKGFQDADAVGLRAHRIPCTPGLRFHLSKERGILVGDAAGLCDPITGEGIYAAVCQARLAAETIGDCFADRSALSAYEARVQSRFGADNACARWMGAFLYHLPGLSHRILDLRRHYLLRRYLAVVAGTTTYRAEFMPPVVLRRLAGLTRRR